MNITVSYCRQYRFAKCPNFAVCCRQSLAGTKNIHCCNSEHVELRSSHIEKQNVFDIRIGWSYLISFTDGHHSLLFGTALACVVNNLFLMRIGKLQDLQLVRQIMVPTFRENHAVRWMLRRGKSYQPALERMVAMSFSKAVRRGGVLIASNEKGVALYVRVEKGKWFLKDLWEEVCFLFTAVPLLKIPALIRREWVRQSVRPSSGAYLYFWFLGVLPDAAGAGFELKNSLFEAARQQQLPIYLETSAERNKRVYERLGFTTYHTWIDEQNDICFWFMKWMPEVQ